MTRPVSARKSVNPTFWRLRSTMRAALLAILSAVLAAVAAPPAAARPPAAKPPPARHDTQPTSVNDTAPGIRYSAGWTYTTTADGYRSGDAHYTTTAGATAAYPFTGRSIAVTGGKNSDHGRADVKVCDPAGGNCGPTTTVDTYSSLRLTRQVVYSADGLGEGGHLLIVTVRSDSSGPGTYTDIDGITTDPAEAQTVLNDSDPALGYSASNWTASTTAEGYAFGDAHWSTTSGATMTYPFSGTSVSLIGGLDPDHGRAGIQICDGSGANCGPPAVIDTYSGQRLLHQTLFRADGLAGGAHRLVLTVRSDSSGSGHFTDVDLVTSGSGQLPLSGTHYVDNRGGSGCSDSGPGTSPGAPWCDFTPVTGRVLAPGGQLLLARGAHWDEPLRLSGSGEPSAPITLGAYGSGPRPVIAGDGTPASRTVVLTDVDHWRVRDLELAHAGTGLIVEYTTLGHQGLDIGGLYAHDLAGIQNSTPRQADFPDIQYSMGVMISSAGTPIPAAGQTALAGISVVGNTSAGNAGVQVLADPLRTGTPAAGASNFSDVEIRGNRFEKSPVPSIAVESATDTRFVDNDVDCGGAVALPQGTTCFFLTVIDNALIQNNVIAHMPDTGSPDETGIDLEYRVKDISIRGNYFGDNAGAGVELLQLGRPADYSLGTVFSGNQFDNNGWAVTSPMQKGEIALFGGAPQVTISDNNYLRAPSGFLNSADGNPALTNVTQSGNHQVASQYTSAFDFATTQGHLGWRSQFFDGSAWADMPVFDPAERTWSAAGGATAGPFDLTPGGTADQWVARTWTAPRSGPVEIRGRAALATAGPGAEVLVEKNGTSVLPAAGGPYARVGDVRGIDTDADLTVAAGDVLRFVVHSTSGTGQDKVSWTPNISYR